MKIAHLEYVSSGKHTAERPRGLHPAVFGANGSGWHGIADKLCPKLAPIAAAHGPIDTVWWCIGGVGATDELLIEDRPFEAAAGHLSQPWSDRLLNRRDFAGAMGRVRHATRGGDVGAYIGAPTQAEADGFLLEMVEAGLIDLIIFDAIALGRVDAAEAQFEAYRKAGAALAYEAITKYGQRDLWTDARWTCCASVQNWEKDQLHIMPHPPHPNRLVHAMSMVHPVLLLDQNTAGPDKAKALAPTIPVPTTFASNLLAPLWQTHLAGSLPGGVI